MTAPTTTRAEQPCFTIITPVFNGVDLIEDTVRSILGQTALASGRARLQYIVRDGGSSDGTVALVESLVDEYRMEASVQIASERDSGMYDALAAGLHDAKGDVIAYLNAGDYYSRYCFDTVLDVIANRACAWVTGYEVQYNAAGAIVKFRLPGPYRPKLLQAGYYGLRGRLGCIQQESTFWTRALMDNVDLTMLRSFKLAGDFYLWSTFGKRARLEVYTSHFGGFRAHGTHLSHDMGAYHDEMRRITAKPTMRNRLVASFDTVCQFLPRTIRKALNGSYIHIWDHKAQAWN